MSKSLSPSALSHQPHPCSLFWLYLQGNRHNKNYLSLFLKGLTGSQFSLYNCSASTQSCPFFKEFLLSVVTPLPKTSLQEEQGTQHPAGSVAGILEVEKCFNTLRGFSSAFHRMNSLIFPLPRLPNPSSAGIASHWHMAGKSLNFLGKIRVHQLRGVEMILPNPDETSHLLPHPTHHQLWPTPSACSIPSLFLPSASR